MLVHEYDDIDDARVHGAILAALEEFPDYASAVEQWLEGYEADNE